MARVLVKRLHEQAEIPTRSHRDDAGLDLYACDPTLGTILIPPGEHRSIATGVAIKIPIGYAGLVIPRSGLAASYGVTVLNAPGLIDSGYRGEIRVLLQNTSQLRWHAVEPGDRIAQLVITAFLPITPVEVTEISETSRGEDGFGSTGR